MSYISRDAVSLDQKSRKGCVLSFGLDTLCFLKRSRGYTVMSSWTKYMESKYDRIFL